MPIELLNKAGQIMVAYIVRRAWICEYSVPPGSLLGAQSVAIQSITLAHEGWERDTSVVEPTEPKTD